MTEQRYDGLRFQVRLYDESVRPMIVDVIYVADCKLLVEQTGSSFPIILRDESADSRYTELMTRGFYQQGESNEPFPVPIPESFLNLMTRISEQKDQGKSVLDSLLSL